MMKAQRSMVLSGTAVLLGGEGGLLRVEAGRIWLTRAGDLHDYVLAAGDEVRVPAGGAVVTAWDRAEARVDWQPQPLRDRLKAALHLGLVSEARDPNLAQAHRPAPLLHNDQRQRSGADGRDSGGRARFIAKEARRCPAGAA